MRRVRAEAGVRGREFEAESSGWRVRGRELGVDESEAQSPRRISRRSFQAFFRTER